MTQTITDVGVLRQNHETCTALAKRSSVPRSAVHHRAKSRRSKIEKNERQQYLGAAEESAEVNFFAAYG